MALVTCKECGKEHSTDAEACPNCGKRRTSLLTKLIGGLFAIGIAMSIYNSQQHRDAESRRIATMTPEQLAAETDAKANATKLSSIRGACLIALKQTLHDPGSAEFTVSTSWYIEERKDGTFQVQPSGRAKNALGAYVKGVWDCIAKYEGANVRVVSLKQIRP